MYFNNENKRKIEIDDQYGYIYIYMLAALWQIKLYKI